MDKLNGTAKMFPSVGVTNSNLLGLPYWYLAGISNKIRFQVSRVEKNVMWKAGIWHGNANTGRLEKQGAVNHKTSSMFFELNEGGFTYIGRMIFELCRRFRGNKRKIC